jgi:hypothetical protein
VTREILRRWPIVLLVAVVAVAAAVVTSLTREGSHAAKVELLLTPLAQFDETFLGTSLVRDAGDAGRTAQTVVDTLDSEAVDVGTAKRLGDGWTPDKVADDVAVTASHDANVVTITGTAPDAETAARLVTTFADAALDVRWRRIDRELTERIAALDELAAISGAAGVQRDRELLAATRLEGKDPTIHVADPVPEVSEDEIGTGLVVVLALIGGLLLGALAALLLARAGRRPGGS